MGKKATGLWIFSFPGFVLFFAFLVLAKKTAGRGVNIQIDVDGTVAIISAFLFLLGACSIVAFFGRIAGLSRIESMDLAGKVATCSMIAFFLMAVDLGFGRFLYNHSYELAESIACGNTPCNEDWILQSVIGLCFSVFSCLIIWANTARKHRVLYKKRKDLIKKITIFGMVVTAICVVLTSQIVGILIISTLVVSG